VERNSEVAMKRALLLALAGCGANAPEPLDVRFSNSPAVVLSDDRHNVPRKPDVNLPLNEVDFFDRSFTGPIIRGLEVHTHRRAHAVNALDEAPDSTWFTNRIGTHDMTPDEIARGPVSDDGPEAHLPWTIRSTKPGGTELGVLVTDARGVKYLVSFDDPSRPEMETGTAVVVNRILWAVGYHVPEDSVAYIRSTDLVLAPDAEIKDHLGNAHGLLDRKTLDRKLANAWHTPDGRIRVMASKYLPGESLGSSDPESVRHHDPNDRIPHQRRRDLRGQYPIFAWVGHIDLVASNFLDMYTTDIADPSVHYVVHYKVDFGKSLGTMGLTDGYIQEGHVYSFDWVELFKQFFSAGLWPRPWGKYWAPPLVGVAPTFTAEAFDPGAWKPDLPYAPFDEADRFDMFWGTKLMARFTPDMIRAAVEAGRFTDPGAVQYLTQTLIARQRATMQYWFARVNPLDRFAVTNHALCFDDLAIGARFAQPGATHYELVSYNDRSQSIGTVTIPAAPAGPTTCTHDVILSTAPDGYTIVEVRTLRDEYAGVTQVHLARDGAGNWRVIGIWRL
jgi:hypothetical protein